MTRDRPIRIATNFARMQQACAGTTSIEQVNLSDYRSLSGLFRLLVGKPKVDLIIVNIDNFSLFRLCLLRWLIPYRTTRLISVDAIFSRPVGLRQRASALLKRCLLRQVDLFILYFRDLSGYERYYGISTARFAYVPFKSNSWEILLPEDSVSSDGDYVLAAGRTKRDLATYLDAMRIAGMPAVLLHQGESRLAQHGTTLPTMRPPANVRFIEHDGGRRTWVDHLKNARVVVVPILGSTISSSGIGTYIDAMALRKAVVITAGPATRGILDDQAITVPPGDADALAAAVSLLWSDRRLRDEIASKARLYAEGLMGEDRLLSDIVKTCIERGLAE